MIVFKNEQGICYAAFSNNFDVDSLKHWLEYYRKFDNSIKAYREDGEISIEIELLEDKAEGKDDASGEEVQLKSNKKK